MINWDCEAKTALSNEEVLYQEDGERSVLYYIKYESNQTVPAPSPLERVGVRLSSPHNVRKPSWGM